MNRDNAVDCYFLCKQEPNHWRAALWFAILLLPISFSAAQETSSKKAATHGQGDAIRQDAIYATLRFVPR